MMTPQETFIELAAKATHLSDAERQFIAEVIPKKVQVDGECWLWTGRSNHYGYGGFRIAKKNYAVHRIVGHAINGAYLERRICVCHKCDTPICVRPCHLFLGTQRDNMMDMISKGRARRGYVRGVEAKAAKLTDQDVVFILRHPEICGTDLAKQFGVRNETVYQVRHRCSWKHIS